MSQFVVLKKLRVQNANAISSPFTYGFPAVTAFLGFAHALERQFNASSGDEPINIIGVGIVSHRFQMLDHRDGYNRTLCLTGNPLNEKGERAPFVEEGRCHMTVSLVLKIDGLSGNRGADHLKEIVSSRLKLAGGDILSISSVELANDDRKSTRYLMPGYALVERKSLMLEQMEKGIDAMDSLHHFVAVHHRSEVADDGQVNWTSKRAADGWLVPIATGFQALSPPDHPENARDTATPHRFAECVVTLGEFVMASRFNSLSELLWRYDQQGDLYVCTQEVNG
jgi:CRISPR-associated protein Csy2